MSFDGLPTYYDHLDASYDEAWTLLKRGKADRRSPFHTPSIASVDTNGCPQVRTVVLRGADQDTATLRFHTDVRSRKIPELRAQPCVSVHVYDKKAKIQLRLTGHATAHTDGPVKEEAWAASREMSRECYRLNKAPGTFVGDANDWMIPQDPAHEDVGKDNFVAVSIKLSALEWLYLARGGHRRAYFEIAPDGGIVSSAWMVP